MIIENPGVGPPSVSVTVFSIVIGSNGVVLGVVSTRPGMEVVGSDVVIVTAGEVVANGRVEVGSIDMGTVGKTMGAFKSLTGVGIVIVLFLAGRIIKFTGRWRGETVMGALTVWRRGTIVTVPEIVGGGITGDKEISRGVIVVVGITSVTGIG